MTADKETMIERVARKICEADGRNPDERYSVNWGKNNQDAPHIVITNWETYQVKARAAIEAMREPTENMYEAGRNALKTFVYALSVDERKARYSKKRRMHLFTEREKFTIRHQAMIDAALNEVS